MKRPFYATPKDGIFAFKILLVGFAAVGKTTLRNQYLGRGFKEDYHPTIGANFSAKRVKTKSSKEFIFQIWDIAGQTSHKELRKHFYRGATGVLALFDITSRRSFDNVTDWIDESWTNSGRGKIPTILIANKTDLIGTDAVEVSIPEGAELAKDIASREEVPVSFLETSALKGFNVDKSFLNLAEAIFSYFEVYKLMSE